MTALEVFDQKVSDSRVPPWRCVRLTRAGRPCRAPRRHNAFSCGAHVTPDEREYADSLEAVHMAEAAKDARRPACWSWPVPLDVEQFDADPYEYLHVWQDRRCALCGHGRRGRTVLIDDHDHSTGWIRGLLCQQCNLREPGGAPLYRRYRSWHPAKILDAWVRYYSPWRGEDFGALEGITTDDPHPVAANGIVLIERRNSLHRSPAYKAGQALEHGLADIEREHLDHDQEDQHD